MKSGVDLSRVIVALDRPDPERNLAIFRELQDLPVVWKLGYGWATQLNACSLADTILSAGKQLFLDLKMRDIPRTIALAVQNCEARGVAFLTVDSRCVGSAIAAKAASYPKIILVDMLTTDFPSATKTLTTAQLCRASKADGAIFSPSLDCRPAKQLVLDGDWPGREFLVICPGIRLAPAAGQFEFSTPQHAFSHGADYVVIGTDVTRNRHPREVLLGLENGVD